MLETGPCLGCGRPLTLWRRYLFAPSRFRTVMLCADCYRLERNRVNALRRRVKHEPTVCVACGVTFVPKRVDAMTCSGACRVRLHRQLRR
jgi:hypothetical protein